MNTFFYINTQAQMLKSFNSLLIQKFSVSANILSEFFSSPLYVREIFFGTMVLSPNPPPPPPTKKKKWLAPYRIFSIKRPGAYLKLGLGDPAFINEVQFSSFFRLMYYFTFFETRAQFVKAG